MTTKHTPTPWRVDPNYPGDFRVDDLSMEIGQTHALGVPCQTPGTNCPEIETSKANAAFIVRAVNHHEALVEALRSVLGHLDAHMEIDGHSIDDLEAADRARSLLAQLDAEPA